MSIPSHLQLANYRRLVFESYARVRDSDLPIEVRWRQFRADQNRLFKSHPQTALTPEQLVDFTSLQYYPYDPAYRFVLPVEELRDREIVTLNLHDDGPTRLKPIGRISFTISSQQVSLTLFWITAYGGGIFLPFKDLTSESETYAGGRYLLDTIKGADLGWERERLVVDFNFAYNPSCAYNSRWHCPLPPVENHLPVPIPAGELRYE
jgi:uncharacterized protein (DUF1684 family)